MQNLHSYILILHPPNPFPCCGRLYCRSSSHHCLRFFLLPCGITQATHLSLLLYFSHAFKYLHSLFPPLFPCFFREDHFGPPLSLLPLIGCHSLSFHSSFFHLNFSQGDLGRAHLLSSPSPSIPSETSEAPFLSQNSPVLPFWLYPSLKLLVSPLPSYFFPFTLGCHLPYFPSILLIIPAHFFISNHLSTCPLPAIWLASFILCQYHLRLNTIFSEGNCIQSLHCCRVKNKQQ